MQAAQAGPKEIVVLFTALIGATYGFGMYLFPAIVESIRREIDFSYGTMGLISGSVQAAFLTSAALAGFLTLRFGAINLILFSIVLCALSLGGLAIAHSVLMLGALLLVLGACASMIWVPMVEVAREIIPARNRGMALGLMSSGTSYGVFINSGLQASVLPTYGWRVMWITTCVIAAVLAIYALVRLAGRDTPTENPNLMIKQTNKARITGLPHKLVGTILLMMFFNGLSCMSFQTYLSAYLIGEVGHAETRTASVWGGIGLVGMFSGFLMGTLADRITIRLGMIVTYVLLSISAIAVILSGTDHTNLIFIYVAAVAFGLSFYAIFGLAPAYISHLFSDGNAALVFAFGNVALGLGGVLGNLFGGYTKEFTGSFLVLYLMIAVAALVSAIIAALLPDETRYHTTVAAAVEKGASDAT